MICFLTSNLTTEDRREIDPSNNLKEELRKYLPDKCSVIFVCSNPDCHERTDFYAEGHKNCFLSSGFRIKDFTVLDGRNEQNARELIGGADLIILAGGHVPTQNRFFNKIGLKDLLMDFQGVVIGISAGSMNSSEMVYVQPEEEGEAIDFGFQRFFPGLGLTKTMLIPHYHRKKDYIIDGLRLFEDVTFPDSIGKKFYAIPDGSYLFIEGGREHIRGEAYLIKDGSISMICRDGESVGL